MPTPAFDAWTTLFSIAAVQGYFIAFILLRWQKGHAFGNICLSVLLFLFALTLTEYVFWWSNYIYQFPNFANVSAQFPLLFGPILYLYFRAIYENRLWERKDWLHIIPFLIGMVLMLPFFVLNTADKTDVLLGNRPQILDRWWAFINVWGRILHMIFYVGLNFYYLAARPKVGESQRWGRSLNVLFLGFVLAYTSYFVLIKFPFFNVWWDYHISAAMTLFIYMIAYSGYVQPIVFEGFTWRESGLVAKYKNSGLTQEASDQIAAKLQQLMETAHLYREPELRLELLANRLGIGKHYVSQVINERFGLSFFDYINGLRVNEARMLLLSTSKKDMNIIEIVYAVGFNNKVSFNTTFKKAMGMTPTEFRKKAQQEGAVVGSNDESPTAIAS